MIDFHALRFDPAHHLGMGDIRLTIAQQDEIEAEIERLRGAIRNAEPFVSRSDIRRVMREVLGATPVQPSPARGPQHQCIYCAMGDVPFEGWHVLDARTREKCTADKSPDGRAIEEGMARAEVVLNPGGRTGQGATDKP